MAVITVGREFGAGGRDVANELARRLNIACIDHEIISRAAARAGVTERTIEELDEKRPSFIRQILDVMGRYGDQGFYAEWGGPATLYVSPQASSPILDTETYRTIVEDVIRGIANQQNAVIIGRGSSIILGNHPDAFHVRIVADLEHKAQWVMEREKLSRLAAEKRVRDIDRQRADYIRTYFKADWSNAHHYDLVLNTGRLGVKTCVNVILDAVEQKLELKAGTVTTS